MIEIELLKGFRLVDLIFILTLANILTKQTVGRRFTASFFNFENYLKYRGFKRFILDAMSCFFCSSFWISILWLVLTTPFIEYDITSYLYVPFTASLMAYILEKE